MCMSKLNNSIIIKHKNKNEKIVKIVIDKKQFDVAHLPDDKIFEMESKIAEMLATKKRKLEFDDHDNCNIVDTNLETNEFKHYKFN